MDNLTKLIDSTEILNEAQLKQQQEGGLFAPKELPVYEPKRDLESPVFSSPRQEVFISQQPQALDNPALPPKQDTAPSSRKINSRYEEPLEFEPTVGEFLKDYDAPAFTFEATKDPFEFGTSGFAAAPKDFSQFNPNDPIEESKLPACIAPRMINVPSKENSGEMKFSMVKTNIYPEETFEMTPRPVVRQVFDDFQATSERNLISVDSQGFQAAKFLTAGDISEEAAEEQLRESLENPKVFVFNPLPQGVWMKCRVIKTASGLFSLGAKYSLETEDGQEILTAKRVAKSIRSYYRIAHNDEGLTEKGLIARLNSNYMGSVFNLYDNGLAPGAKGHPALTSEDNTREELATIAYVTAM